jgi:hypothetical protein
VTLLPFDRQNSAKENFVGSCPLTRTCIILRCLHLVQLLALKQTSEWRNTSVAPPVVCRRRFRRTATP